MYRYYKAAVVFFFALFLSSCKKDMLHLQKVQQINTNTKCRLNHVRFVGSDICLMTGGDKYGQSEILRSSDGGHTFSSYSDAQAAKGMYGFGQTPSGKIYLCGDGTVMSSAD